MLFRGQAGRWQQTERCSWPDPGSQRSTGFAARREQAFLKWTSLVLELAGKVKEMVPSAGTPKSNISEEALKEDTTSLLLNFEINKVGNL